MHPPPLMMADNLHTRVLIGFLAHRSLEHRASASAARDLFSAVLRNVVNRFPSSIA